MTTVEHDSRPRWKHRVEFALARWFLRSFAQRPLAAAMEHGARLGRRWHALDARHRSLARRNVMRGLGLDEAAAAALVRECFEHLGRTLAEVALLDRHAGDLIASMDLDGAEHLHRALAAGRGVLILSGHCGNWELLSARFAREAPSSLIVRPLDNPLLDDLLQTRRHASGFSTIRARGATRGILRALQRGEIIGIALDQRALRRKRVFVPFFGRPVAANFGLALLAIRSGAPVLPAFAVREADGRSRACIGPPVPPAEEGEMSARLGVTTARYTAAIEAHVRKYPAPMVLGPQPLGQHAWPRRRHLATMSPADYLQRHRVAFGRLALVAFLVCARPTPVWIASGAALYALGAAVRSWAAGHLRKREVLAVTGPYAHTRNPLYFGSFLMAAGALVMGRNPWFAAVALTIAVVVYQAAIRREEVLLEKIFGEAFAAYAREVPRFIPRLRVPAGQRGSFDRALWLQHREWRAWLGGVLLAFVLLARWAWWP